MKVCAATVVSTLNPPSAGAATESWWAFHEGVPYGAGPQAHGSVEQALSAARESLEHAAMPSSDGGGDVRRRPRLSNRRPAWWASAGSGLLRCSRVAGAVRRGRR